MFSSFRHPGSAPLPVLGNLPGFDAATGWLNSDPLTPEALRGRVVLVQFWTYTCINWLRTLPYVRAWNEKYGADGLTVVGAHTPEFDFERNVDNIVEAARDMRVPGRLPSTATTGSGAHSPTISGRPHTSPTPRAVSATRILARASTR